MGRKGSGVEIRESSIRIKFVFRGETIRERVTMDGRALPPTPPNIKVANRLAADIHRAIAMGTFELRDFFPDSKRLTAEQKAGATFGALADLWLASKGRLADATRDQYATATRFWKNLLGNDTPVTAITHKLIAAKVGGYPWPSSKTHNNYLIALRGVFALEYRGADAARSPMVGIENMALVRKLPDPLTPQERDRILTDLRKHYPTEVYAYFLWQFFTGMRPQETIALRWSDLDQTRGTIRVRRVRTFRGAERDGTKTNAERDVDLTPQALEALTIMRPLTSMLRVERDGDDDQSADIFRNPVTGKPWHDERSQRDHYWRPALKRLGIRWRSAYNTRHTFATVALMAGLPPAYIASILGHTVAVLLSRYARWIPEGTGTSPRELLARAMGAPQIEFVPNSSQDRAA